MRATASLEKAPPTCRVCGLPSSKRVLVCRSCGSIEPIEGVLASLRSLLRRMRRSGDLSWLLLWGLALTPILIVPPLAAVLVAWRSSKHRSTRMDATWLTIVALSNVAVSLILIARLESHLAATLAWLENLWRAPPPKIPSDLRSI